MLLMMGFQLPADLWIDFFPPLSPEKTDRVADLTG